MIYEQLRHFADSWGLVLMGLMWIALVGWAFLPGNRNRNRDAAHMIFKDSDHG
ncbi:cbb3-type cytochrome c oxidase subunit 3 [Sphingosinicella rhizophila]|uniref:Cbb3-type cytochrome c oxidase subunit 3 n=1 Tax=Sphingosinicella rhizophila TaxID=3050082 RepID=A0ABU3Q520_9SPHN|nr:cbb3-type cytochrome c oxidase subunit 3 [Sphingosinicella sp. GR2756]MDT9598508.1 cbb3-type cytochrome c oxidase subunit 3 [Sphingosinicella sp. GR2756]